MNAPRFTLRTLFVAVTLLAIPPAWFACNVARVRERTALLGANGVQYILPSEETSSRGPIPRMLTLFGAVPIAVIYVADTVPNDVFMKIVATFPEAFVKRGKNPEPLLH